MRQKIKRTMVIELEYDDATHWKDANDQKWFVQDVLMCHKPELVLYSTLVGDIVGNVRVVNIDHNE